MHESCQSARGPTAGKEERHHSAQTESNRLGRVVMFFDSILHAERGSNKENYGAKTGENPEPSCAVVRCRPQPSVYEGKGNRKRPQYHRFILCLHFPHPVGLNERPYPYKYPA